MKNRYSYTQPEKFKAEIPWKLAICVLVFTMFPFILGWIIKFADEIDSTQINHAYLGWGFLLLGFYLLFRKLRSMVRKSREFH